MTCLWVIEHLGNISARIDRVGVSGASLGAMYRYNEHPDIPDYDDDDIKDDSYYDQLAERSQLSAVWGD